jgi:TolA-binding protein
MMVISYNSIPQHYKLNINVCNTTVVTPPIYYVRQDVFDREGNIEHKRLENLKESYTKRNCIQQAQQQILQLQQQLQQRDDTINTLRTTLQNRVNQLSERLSESMDLT